MQIKSVLSFPTMGFYSKVRFSQDSDLFKVQFRQISLFLIVRAWLCKLQKRVQSLDSQPQVIKFTSCLPMGGGSLRVLLRLLPPLKLVVMI
jgi:hypothetical protein